MKKIILYTDTTETEYELAKYLKEFSSRDHVIIESDELHDAIIAGKELVKTNDGLGLREKTAEEIEATDAENVADRARSIRDRLLRDSDKLVLPDRDFSDVQYNDILTYRETLRNWPDSPSFPDTSAIPPVPV